MQRNGCFAGAGTTLYDENTGEWRPDDPVLFGLDRGDDVAHAPGPGSFERSEQCAFADNR